MLLQKGLDLAGVDVDAAPDDHVLGAPFQEQVALVVQHAQVPRIEPAILEGLRRGVWIVPESAGYRRAAVAHAPDHAIRYRLVVLVDALQLDRKHGTTDRFVVFR